MNHLVWPSPINGTKGRFFACCAHIFSKRSSVPTNGPALKTVAYAINLNSMKISRINLNLNFWQYIGLPNINFELPLTSWHRTLYLYNANTSLKYAKSAIKEQDILLLKRIMTINKEWSSDNIWRHENVSDAQSSYTVLEVEVK